MGSKFLCIQDSQVESGLGFEGDWRRDDFGNLLLHALERGTLVEPDHSKSGHVGRVASLSATIPLPLITGVLVRVERPELGLCQRGELLHSPLLDPSVLAPDRYTPRPVHLPMDQDVDAVA